jgi:hypothetical protein
MGRPPKLIKTTATERAAANRKARLEAGGMPINGVLSPEASETLQTLLDAGYGANKLAVIERLILSKRIG